MKKSKFFFCNKLFSCIKYHQLLITDESLYSLKFITNKKLLFFIIYYSYLFHNFMTYIINKFIFLSQLRPMGNNEKENEPIFYKKA